MIPAAAAFHLPTFRLVAARWPVTGPFDRMVSPEDAVAAVELATATDDAMTGALGRLRAIARSDWALAAHGPGAELAMAAFLHPAPGGGRFNGPALGAWYAALDLETALAESLHHHGRRLAASAAGHPARIEVRELRSRPRAELIDLRDRPGDDELFRAGDYRASQAFGEARRREGADGLRYRSVRRASGECIALYKPRLVPPVRDGGLFELSFDAAGRPAVARRVRLR